MQVSTSQVLHNQENVGRVGKAAVAFNNVLMIALPQQLYFVLVSVELRDLLYCHLIIREMLTTHFEQFDGCEMA
jgi:hypothetical protein